MRKANVHHVFVMNGEIFCGFAMGMLASVWRVFASEASDGLSCAVGEMAEVERNGEMCHWVRREDCRPSDL